MAPTTRPSRLERTEPVAAASGEHERGQLTEITPGVWRAFDQAIEDARDTFSPAVSSEDLSPFLDSLQDSVRCVVIGVSPHPASPAPSISTTQVLECVR